MLRRLLTLIAICAGLTAVAEPARAAVTMVESVRMVERASAACAARVAVGRAPISLQSADLIRDKSKPCPRPTIIVIVPTVMLRIDRSRE